MAKKATALLESLGWVFWTIVFVILSVPLIYVCFKAVRPDEPWFVPISLGLISAAFSAAIVTWAANSTLQAVNARKAAAAKGKRKR